jgi:hypothetical protein
MISAADHSSRSLVHRRVSSWSEVSTRSAPQQQQPQPQPLEERSLASEDELSRPLLLPELEYENEVEDIRVVSRPSLKFNWKLWIVFLLLVLSGVSNVVLAKLQSLPM